MRLGDLRRTLDIGLATLLVMSLFATDTPLGPRLVTNEYAHWNPTDAGAPRSSVWDMTSGSLFASEDAWWTGPIDDRSPDANSINGTDSAVFRLTTHDRSFGNVRVNLGLRVETFATTARTPAEAWDGVHIFLRYQSQFHLYYASINRRDGTTAIKKKEPGGVSNGGTYYTLARGEASVPVRDWQTVAASIRTLTDGSVRIALYRGPDLLLDTVDDGSIGGPPITAAGAVGIRGDNCEFEFRAFTVTDLDRAAVVFSPRPESP